MRTILSLLILLSAASVIFTNGCVNADIAAGKENTVTKQIKTFVDNNTPENFETATFAMG